MIALFALLALAAWAVPATVVAITRDGYRAVPTLLDYDSVSPRSA
jgi:hypothetical protein